MAEVIPELEKVMGKITILAGFLGTTYFAYPIADGKRIPPIFDRYVAILKELIARYEELRKKVKEAI